MIMQARLGAAAVGALLVVAAATAAQTRDAAWLAGDWHLVDANADEEHLPQHRMDIRLQSQGGQLRAAILSRVDGREMAMASASFNGTELRLQMRAPAGRDQAAMPVLVMKLSGEKFEGRWQLPAGAAGDVPETALKLIRARRR
jgi:hypothetical protein